MTEDDRELAAASGAYALHALDGQEEKDFERLLERSPGLRNEVTELTDTAVELGLAVAPEAPPADLRSRILAATEGVAQLPTEQASTTPASTETSSIEPSAPDRIAPVVQLAWYRRPIGALVAAAAAIVLVTAGAVGAGIAQTAPSASQVAAVAAVPDAQHATVRIAGGGTARAVWSDRLGRSGLTLEGLPALSLDRTFQLWYIHGSTARSAGLVSASGSVALSGAMHRGDVIGVTVEPAGGSTAPTTTPIVTVTTT